MKLQVNYILQTMEKMAELKVNTIEPRFRKYISLMAFFEHPFQPMSPIRLVNKAVSIPGKIVQLTSKVRWVTGLKEGTSQLSAGYVKPSTHTPPGVSPYFLNTCPVHTQVLVQEQPGDQLHPVASEPVAVLVDDPRS